MFGHRGDWPGMDLVSLEDLIVFEHGEDGVQEFAHGGDQGWHPGVRRS